MTYNSDEMILPEDFTGDFLLSLSNQVEKYRREQPDDTLFQEQRKSWNKKIEQLGGSLLELYDNTVTPAFADYQNILEERLFKQSMIHAAARHLRSEEAAIDPERLEIPGLDQAADKLNQVCRQLIRQLDGETGKQCAAYLKLRKERIDANRRLCWQCGMEFAETLFP